LILFADGLIGKSDVEINAGVTIGKIEKWEAVLHDRIQNFIKDQPEGFLDKDIAAQKQDLIRTAQETLAQPIAEDIDVESLVTRGANGEVTGVSESAMRLRGTVGGIQGILAIQQAVAKGVTDKAAAILLLKEIYDFDDATAKSLIAGIAQLTLEDKERV